jgi:hypothetical protein
MKKLIVMSALVVSMVFSLGFGSNAVASGRAAALLAGTSQGSLLAVIDFDQTQFSQADAAELTSILQFGGSVLINLLTSNAPGVTASLTVFTPAQMTSFGLGDADTANLFVLNNFNSFALIGVVAYVKAVVTKVQPPAGVTGQNIRLDFYLFAPGINIVGSTPTYVGSAEVPESLIQSLGSSLM